MNKIIHVYLIRHAESAENVCMGKEYYEDDDNGLTELGKLQASTLGEKLAGLKISRVYSSDFLRAQQTADLILNSMDGMSKLEIHASEKLRELDFGNLSSASYLEKAIHFLSDRFAPLECTAPEGESALVVGRRMMSFLEDIYDIELRSQEMSENREPINILVVSHSVSIASLLLFLGSRDKHPHELINFDTKKDIKILKNIGYYKLRISHAHCATAVVSNSPKKARQYSLQIEVLEKNISCYSQLEMLNEKEKQSKEKVKLHKLMSSSEKGRELLACYQQ